MCPVVIISWLSFIFGFASSEIKQSLVAMGKINRAARVECEVSINLNDNPLHWYQRIQGGALHRVSYLPAGSGSPQNDPGFTATKHGKKSILTILTAKETADYYCAYWETHSENIKRKSRQKRRQQNGAKTAGFAALRLLPFK